MQRLILTALLMSCCALLTSAQNTNAEVYPKVEWFVGISSNHFFYDDSPFEVIPQNIASLFSNHAEGQIGFETSFTRNIHKFLGLKGDFSSYFDRKPQGKTSAGDDFQVNSRTLSFLAGPEIKARNHTRLTPFAHALVGVARSRSEFKVARIGFSDSHTRIGLAMALGGGVDLRVSERFSLRGMLDYTPTFLGDADPSESGKQKHSRLSLGILFH